MGLMPTGLAHSTPPDPARRRGPRSGGGDTRAAILAAAREEFAERGYAAATVRSIGSAAGVDAAMINHYFGTKAGLFQEVIQLPVDPTSGLAEALAGPRQDIGRRLALYFLGLWEQPDFREPIIAVLRSAEAEPSGGRMVREYLLSHVLPQVRGYAVGPDPTRQVALAMSHLVGVAMGRHVLRMDPLATPGVEELADAVGPAVGRYLDGTYRD
jgi:AcrR family transcriptional regulator